VIMFGGDVFLGVASAARSLNLGPLIKPAGSSFEKGALVNCDCRFVLSRRVFKYRGLSCNLAILG
jgi:hypothetical protein